MEKQIKEMAKVIHIAEVNFVKERVKCIEQDVDFPYNTKAEFQADCLISAGYRKSSEVAREIFEELDKFIITKVIDNGNINYDIGDKYKALKKKYGIEGINSREKLKRSRNKLRRAFKKYKGVGE